MKMENSKIINEEVFEFEYEDFSIFYVPDKNLWYASHEDEDKYPNDVLIENDNIKYEDDLILFNIVFIKER